MRAWLEKMKACHEETKACLGKVETTIKSQPGINDGHRDGCQSRKDRGHGGTL
jgi:hypothetical protein